MIKIFIGRQPVLTSDGRIFGYELTFRDHRGREEDFPQNLTATSRVLINTINHFDFNNIRGGGSRVASVNVDHTIISSGIIEMLNPEFFILELQKDTNIDDELVEKVIKLKDAGYKFAIDDFDCSSEMVRKFGKILKLADIVKIDVTTSNLSILHNFVVSLKKMDIKVLALNVATKEDYHFFTQMGFNLYQGYYFQEPEVIEGKIYNNTSSMEILKVIELIRREKSTKELKDFFKIKPDLSYNLLKYLNSSFVGVSQKVSSIEQAITLMGRKMLLRWLLFYLYSQHDSNEFSEILLETAISRAFTMEEMFIESNSHKAFLVGMYSMLDALFNAKFSDLFSDIKLESFITDAILEGKGELGKALTKVQSLEKDKINDDIIDNYEKYSVKKNMELYQKVHSKEMDMFKNNDE